MVVSESNGGGIDSQCRLYDFADRDVSAVIGTAKQFFESDKTQAVVEPRSNEDLVLVFRELETKPVAEDAGVSQRNARLAGAGFERTQGAGDEAVMAGVGIGRLGVWAHRGLGICSQNGRFRRA